MSPLSEYISSLQEVVQQLHRCVAVHCDTIFVDERFCGRTLWKGNVEVFKLDGHPKAAHCFAWLHDDGKSTRYVALPESSAIASPEMAVRAIIAFSAPQTERSHSRRVDASG